MTNQQKIQQTIDLARNNLTGCHSRNNAEYALGQAEHFIHTGQLGHAANMACVALGWIFGNRDSRTKEANVLAKEIYLLVKE